MTDDHFDEICLGTDVVEIKRFRDLESDSPFYRRVFTANELDYCKRFSDSAPHLATTFAGKEAVVKATSSICNLSIDSIEILRRLDGSPYVLVHKYCPLHISISLSYSSTHAVAVALSLPKSISDQKHIQGLLDETIQQLLPSGEMS
ncbi:MAG: holo-ACP synthase [Candidatus Thorarchaeota archaeon]